MPKPKQPLPGQRMIAAQTKFTLEEHAAFQEFKKTIGGKAGALRDADAIRYAMASACKTEGVAWPIGAS